MWGPGAHRSAGYATSMGKNLLALRSCSAQGSETLSDNLDDVGNFQAFEESS